MRWCKEKKNLSNKKNPHGKVGNGSVLTRHEQEKLSGGKQETGKAKNDESSVCVCEC